MLKSFASILLLVFFIIIQSCKSGGKENTDGVLAEVNGVKLIKKDLPEELIKKFGTNDSSGYLKAYIDHWVITQLSLNAANDYLDSDEKNNSKLIEDYQNSLVLYTYEQKLIKEKLDTAVTENDIETFYTKNQNTFQLKKNIVKIRYVKLNIKQADITKLKSLMQNPSILNDSLLKIMVEKVNADNFYIDDNWLYLDDITKEITLDENYDQERFLSNNKFIKIEENGVTYLLYIIDFRIKDTPSPLSLEKDKIKDILLYQRKLEFLKNNKTNMLNKAYENGNVKVY